MTGGSLRANNYLFLSQFSLCCTIHLEADEVHQSFGRSVSWSVPSVGASVSKVSCGIVSAKEICSLKLLLNYVRISSWDWLTWTTLMLLFRWSALTNTVNSGATASFLLIKEIYFNMSQDSSFQSSEVTVQDPYSFIRSCKGFEPLLLISSVFIHDL